MANASATGKFWTYAEIEHAQDLDITNLYLTNIGNGGSWVKGKRVWSNGRESGKPILGFPLRFF